MTAPDGVSGPRQYVCACFEPAREGDWSIKYPLQWFLLAECFSSASHRSSCAQLRRLSGCGMRPGSVLGVRAHGGAADAASGGVSRVLMVVACGSRRWMDGGCARLSGRSQKLFTVGVRVAGMACYSRSDYALTRLMGCGLESQHYASGLSGSLDLSVCLCWMCLGIHDDVHIRRHG